MRTLMTFALSGPDASLLHRAIAAGPNSTGPAAALPTNSSPNSPGYVLKVQSDLVLTNVVVRDKHTGAVVKGLTAKDFTILENGKPQTIDTFDFQSIDQAEPLNEATVSGKEGQLVLGKGNSTGVVTGDELRNHRLVVLFFDLTSMQPDDLTRSIEAAKNYINRQMQAADLVAAVSLDASITWTRTSPRTSRRCLRPCRATTARSRRVSSRERSRRPTR